MLATVAAFRLLGWGGALLAAAAIVLTHHESGAPGWLWINLFVAVALLRFVPEGRLRTWVGRYQFVSLVALGFVLIAFGVQQYRYALHPQLMQDDYGYAAAARDCRSAGVESHEACRRCRPWRYRIRRVSRRTVSSRQS